MHRYLKLVRPKQWIKNAFVFAPLFFAHQFTNMNGWYFSLLAACGFLCVSCVVYIVNDMKDITEDRLHPVKCLRPLAAGTVTMTQAVFLACIAAVFTTFILAKLPKECTYIAAVYVGLNLCYTLFLKRVAIIDVFFIAFCYVLRVLMGCYALKVTVSPWIILTTFLLSLFLGFGKRYHEVGIVGYNQHKPNLRNYNRDLLDRLVTICGGATLITYAIYTAEISHQIGHVEIVYTLAFVAFGLFRYLQSVYVMHEGGEPENIIIKDRLQLANAALWLITTLWILSW